MAPTGSKNHELREQKNLYKKKVLTVGEDFVKKMGQWDCEIAPDLIQFGNKGQMDRGGQKKGQQDLTP